MLAFRKSILIKFIAIFVFFILIPVTLAGVMLQVKFKEILLDNNTKKNLQLTEQIAYNIDNSTRLFIHTAASIFQDDDILPSIGQLAETGDKQKIVELTKQVESKLEYYFNYTNDLVGIVFMLKDGGYYSFKNSPRITEHEIRQMSWYQDIIKNKNSVQVLGSVQNFLLSNLAGDYVISLAVSPSEIGGNNVELIYFAFRTSAFEKLYSRLKLSRVGRVDIVSKQGEPVISDNEKLIGYIKQNNVLIGNSGWAKGYIDNSELLITYYTVQSTGWKVINSIPYNELTYEVNVVIKYLVFAFVFIGIVYIVVFFSSTLGTIILPIKSLMKHMKKVEGGDFTAEIAVSGEDEISKLKLSFISMVREIQNLINRIEAEKTEKMHLEIQALQYQINPHFLFNTLNAITMMASMQGAGNIKKMTDALTKLLLNTMDKGGSLTTVEKEIDNLNNYLYIMKIRYGDRFNIKYNINCEENSLYILKLLLQPIVENSIIHYSSDIYSKLEIHLDISSTEEKLIVVISDTGAGMSERQINELMNTEKKNTRGFNKIGISNVNRRIKLNYGDEYGLKIISKENEGTTVIMELPVIRNGNILLENGDGNV